MHEWDDRSINVADPRGEPIFRTEVSFDATQHCISHEINLYCIRSPQARFVLTQLVLL